MSALILPHRLQQQPQQALAIDWSNPLARGLKLAIVPSLGHVNLASGALPVQSTPMVRGTSLSGVTNNGSSRAEYPGFDTSKGLTVVSVWRAKATHYLSSDATRSLASNRTAANAGWSYGRNSAAAGGATGNLTRQSLTFQGVAQYTETNYAIESFVDTPVACRYNRAAALISWFRFGAKSSPDTATGSMTTGGNVVVGATGDYAGNTNPWIDRFSVLLVFDQPKTDAEIRALSDNPWQVFKAPARRLWVVPAAAPVGPITGTLSAAEATDSLAAAGTAGFASVSGTVAASESADTLAAVGTAFSPITGTLAATEAPDVLSARDTAQPPAAGGGGGAGNVREVRAFADELDKVRKPTKGEKKRRKQAIEAAVLELLPDEPAAEVAAPYITQLVARNLPPATWAPVHGPRAITLPPAVVDDVRARVNEWLAMQALVAELEDDFETELLLLG